MPNSEIRKASFEQAAKLGYPINHDLPLLDSNLTLRPQDEIVIRCLSLYLSVSCAFGFDRTIGQSWLEKENLFSGCSSAELEFLATGAGDADQFQKQVECLQAFAWLLGIVESLSFAKYCDETLITQFPDVRSGASSAAFRLQSTLRPEHEIIHALDLAYCLHWSIMDAHLSQDEVPGLVYPYVVIERRRALEWVLGNDPWDELSLDT